MRSRMLLLGAVALAFTFGTQACSGPANLYAGPGCRIDLYTLPNLQGYGVPVVRDTPELAEAWRNMAWCGAANRVRGRIASPGMLLES
jgi:hypothetical protein